jgi:hypothetical protein
MRKSAARKPPAGAPTAAPAKAERRTLLVHEARDNPFAWFTSEEVAVICGFGVDVMTALRAMGAPVVGRKMNPELLLRWIEKNSAYIGKIRPDEA